MKLSFDVNRTKAILIGTSKYANFIDISPVTYNLLDFAEILHDNNIFGLPDSHIITLLEKNHDEVLISISDFLQNEDNIDIETLILYFAGHGYRTKNKELYLITKNSHKEFVENTAIPYNRIKSLIENSNIQQRIVIIDACHSGLAAMDDNDKTYTENELDIKGTYVITSSAGNEKSLFDAEKRNTFFTEELLQIFKKGLKKQVQFLTLDDCFDILQQNLVEKKLPRPQRQTNLNTPKFYFFKNKKFDKNELIKQAFKYDELGEYEKALREFEMIRDEFTDSAFNEKIQKCKDELKFKAHKTNGDNLFKEKKYEQAINEYYKSAFIKKNSEIEKKINECETYIQIKKELLEDQFWNIAQIADSIDVYKEYLSKYPNGKFVDDAKGKINQTIEIKAKELPKVQEEQVQNKLKKSQQLEKTELEENQIIESIKTSRNDELLKEHETNGNESLKKDHNNEVEKLSIINKIEKSGTIERFLKKQNVIDKEKKSLIIDDFSGKDSMDKIRFIETSGLMEKFLKSHEISEEIPVDHPKITIDIIKAIEASGLIENFLKKDEKEQKKGFFSRILKK